MRCVKRLLAGLLCIVVLLGGCAQGDEPSALVIDVAAAPRTLDPQRASDDTALLILHNVFEGLMRDGEVNDAVVERLERPSATMWRFTLREDAAWQDGAPLTADDFMFAFERLSGLRSHSPYPAYFDVIEGFDGLGPFGVRALDDRTVEFRLQQEDELFANKLSLAAAFPCRRDFFESTRGRYGQDHKTLLCNGAFKISRVADTAVTIAANGVSHPGVRFVVTPDAQARVDRFAAGETSLASMNATDVPAGVVTVQREGSVLWTMLCNLRDGSPLLDPLLREALLRPLDAQALAADVIPSAWRDVFGPYSADMTGLRLAVDVDPAAAKRAAQAYYAQAGVSALPQLHCIVRDDAFYCAAASDIQRLWLDLSLPVNIRPLPPDEFEAALKSGDFDLAIAPVLVREGQPRDLLAPAMGTSGGIADLGFRDEAFTTFVDASYTADAALSRAAVREAAQLLLDSYVLRPLWGEQRVLVGHSDIAVATGGGLPISARATTPEYLRFL